MTRRAYLYFALTFLLGLVLGGASIFLYAWYGGHWRNPFDKQHVVRQMTDDLKLDGSQVQQVTQIIDESYKKFQDLRTEVHPRFEALRQETNDRIRQVLTPDQITKFNQMVQRWRLRR